MTEQILVPRSRQPRILHLLNLDPSEQVLEILLDATGGAVTRLKADVNGNLVTDANGEHIIETADIIFIDEPDPLRSSTDYRRDRD